MTELRVYEVPLNRLIRMLDIPSDISVSNVWLNEGKLKLCGSVPVKDADTNLHVMIVDPNLPPFGSLKWVEKNVSQKSLADLAGLSSEEEDDNGE